MDVSLAVEVFERDSFGRERFSMVKFCWRQICLGTSVGIIIVYVP